MIGENNYFPKNFDDVLATIVYERLDIISKKYFNNFRFYNFSYFTIDNFYYIDDGSYYSRDGKISFIVSSVDEEFIRFFISRLIVEGLIYEDNYLKVVDVSLIDIPDFTKETVFHTISPIQVNLFKCKSDLMDYLKQMLLDNYCEYYSLIYPEESLKMYAGDFVEKHNSLDEEYDNYYNMQIILEGEIELIRFAWDIGLGESNFKGFGMLGLS